ncbi:MAG TPA: histidine kinase N-terminal domain-containing protein [Micromonosporaceae bacterium]|nr:histidine kinase N-terminal domain-containing protein [Micromonosporaceae bacterium]
MSTLRDLVEEYTSLGPIEVEHLHRLAGDWQLLADLSFADLLLWVAVDPARRPVDPDRPTFVCVAQVRPTTAPTAYQDDHVGRSVSGPEYAHLAIAHAQGRIWREGDPVWYGDTPARHEAIPVRLRDGVEVIAVVGRDTNLAAARTPSQLEMNYLTTADDLAQMVADGTFPGPRQPGETTSAPRVGDGLIRLDGGGRVSYASPNAQSAYRRLGLASHLVGEDLADITSRITDDPVLGADAGERIRAALRGQSPARMEIDARGATVLQRALPLLPAGVPIGALVLVRDVTELRRRDRELMTKDATIREIHHRVKNNLQTVAALLRLQARRVTTADARTALEESVRRVGSIAIVHEILSMSVDEVVEFDGIVDRIAAAAVEVAAPETKVRLRRDSSFGALPAEIATPLAMILNELLLNAVEHGFTGSAEDAEVVISAHRFRRQLHVTVADNGRGLPEDFTLDAADRLGLQIVRTLAAGELRGSIEMRSRVYGGTEAVLVVPLTRR